MHRSLITNLYLQKLRSKNQLYIIYLTMHSIQWAFSYIPLEIIIILYFFIFLNDICESDDLNLSMINHL